jgi:hypothetical protein
VSGFWRGIGIAFLAVGLAVIVGLAVFAVPIFGTTAVRGVHTKNLSNAKQWGLAVKVYATDYEGRFPMHLSELVPDYISLTAPTDLLFEVCKDSKDAVYAKQDWLYFGAFFDEKNPPPILIASPQATGFSGKPPKRIVVYGDLSGRVVTEEQYQADLKKTIEAMRQRATSLPPPPAQDKPFGPETEGEK